MKRRTFVQTGVAGALGLALQPAGLRFLTPNQQGIHSWLNQFAESMQSRPIRASRVLSNTELQMTESLDAYFSKRYFQRESSRLYLVANTDFSQFFYPVFLRHASAGLCDILVPVFIKKDDDTWRHIGTFTGFQVEALARAAAMLKGADLKALLMPIEPGVTEGPVYSYKTRTGSVSISTVVKGKGTTSMQVYSGGQLVLEENFGSDHCLNSGSI